MTLVSVDDRGRMTIPKEMSVKKTRAVIIPAGSFLIVVPLPARPQEVASSWLPTKRGKKELKELAEESARKDAAKRAGRRHAGGFFSGT
jgi:bifunctional DNA-binding transcriptional regulator/antitoxin component of YhaV-PrlF toxin-antitoxin module